jgi:serine/threonine protein phosphatase PrpC
MGGMGRGGMRQGGRPAVAMPTDAEIDGPPTPGLMRQLLSLDAAQDSAYTRSWDSLMAATKPVRDSAHAAVKAVHDGFAGGDRAGARSNAASAQQLAKALKQDDDAFDHSLKALLSKDQQKRYEKWKDDNRKEAEERQHEEMRSRMGGRRGGGGGGGGVPSF